MKQIICLLMLLVMVIIPSGASARHSKNQYLPHTDWLKRTAIYPNKASLMKLPAEFDDFTGLSVSIDHALGIKNSNIGYQPFDSGKSGERQYLRGQRAMYGVLSLYPKTWLYGIKVDKLDKLRGKELNIEKSSRTTCESYAIETKKVLTRERIKVQVPEIDEKEWKFADLFVDKPEFRYEYVPKDQEIHTYKQKYIIEFFSKDFAKNLAEYTQKYDRFNRIFASDLCLKYFSNIKEHGQNEIIYDWGYGVSYENTYSLIKEVQDGYIRVAITQMVPFSQSEKDKWLKILDKEMRVQEK